MRRVSSLLTLAASLAVASLGTACHIDTTISPDDFWSSFETKGQNGVADFSLSAGQCPLGCKLDTPVLQGSTITVQATVTTRTDEALALVVTDAAMGTPGPVTRSCTCSGNNEAKTVDCSSTCDMGMQKSLLVSVDVQTAAAGDVEMKLVDAAGALVDASKFVARPASSLTATVSSQPKGAPDAPLQPGADGTYTVQVGNEVAVSFDVKDADGKQLAFTQHGVIPTYSNPSALAPTSDITAKVLASTNQEVADARASGDGRMLLTAQGASALVQFHVVH